MSLKDFNCNQCGNCCLNLYAFSTSATEEDVKLWRENGREDILEWIDSLSIGGDQFVYDIWISPITGDDVNRCPWLRKLPNKNKYICRIHDVKQNTVENTLFQRNMLKKQDAEDLNSNKCVK